jgi:hypothetical protein
MLAAAESVLGWRDDRRWLGREADRRISEEGHSLGWGGAAIQRHRRAGGELPDRCFLAYASRKGYARAIQMIARALDAGVPCGWVLVLGLALDQIFAWSIWRRMRQAVAKACHWQAHGLCWVRK